MEGPTVDPEHEDRAPLVMRAAERQLGEDRFGGARIDRTAPSRPVIGVAAVEPSQSDVVMIVVHPGASRSVAFGDLGASYVLRTPSDPAG